MTILIVEDNDGMRAMIRSIVAGLAETVHECRDGVEAIAAYAGHRPAWVLMDIALPRLDGIAATRRIRQLDPDARVIVVTNYDDPEVRLAAHSAGACEFVGKHDLLRLRELLR